MSQIFNVKQAERKKGLSLRVREKTASEYARLRERIKTFAGIEHTLDDQFDKAILRIITKANDELNELEKKN